jgi:2-methylisocitrate lyase-like PEP mutase family enzyme
MSQDAYSTFRALHESSCFVIPNPWDVGSAKCLAHLGFKALATTSAGFAFTLGRPDRLDALPRDLVLAHARDLVAATPLPVNLDYQNGYADDPAGVAENVALAITTGVAGLSVEDATGNDEKPLYETALAVERIRAARKAIDDSGKPVFLTARCEAQLLGVPDATKIVLERMTAFAEAGADCVFAPAVLDLNEIRAIVKAAAPKPVNVLVPRPGLTVAQLAEAGVRRISVGSALARVAFGTFLRAAQTIATEGTFDVLGSAAPFAELNAIFT